MSKVLIAVLSCHDYRERADAVRQTWAKDVPSGVDLRFFLGNGPLAPLADEVHLDAPDSYAFFPLKVQAMRKWALEHGYEHVFKTDDDTYVRPERLMGSGFEQSDYRGRLRGPSGGYPYPYCSGFAYWLSRKALSIMAEAKWNGDTAEDRFTANVLFPSGIKPDHDPRFAVTHSKRNSISFVEPPLQGNVIIASCEYTPEHMRAVHSDFRIAQSRYKAPQIAPGPLNRVAVMIKTFWRDGYLMRCLHGLEASFPDMKIILVDDGEESTEKIRKYADLRLAGHSCIWLAFDSGFGAKANAAIEALDRDFILIGSDDFDFKDPCARQSVQWMLKVLDADPEMDVASGRVNQSAYEGLLSFNGDCCTESRGYRESREVREKTGIIRYHVTDLTVNFSLIRRRVFDKVRWDGGDVKIGGGEHGAFFIDLKRAGFKVCYVEGANINELVHNMPQWQHARYPEMRARARQPGRICLARRGINYYTTFGGHVEECAPSSREDEHCAV